VKPFAVRLLWSTNKAERKIAVLRGLGSKCASVDWKWAKSWRKYAKQSCDSASVAFIRKNIHRKNDLSPSIGWLSHEYLATSHYAFDLPGVLICQNYGETLIDRRANSLEHADEFLR
jgi:hypothetical protein